MTDPMPPLLGAVGLVVIIIIVLVLLGGRKP
jgi:hypothetical protein